MNSSYDANEKDRKKKFSIRHPTKRFFRDILNRNDGSNIPRPTKDESEASSHAIPYSSLVAESGKMVGRRKEKLTLFEQDGFELNSFVTTHMANLSEKNIDNLKTDLTALQDHCEKEVQSVIHGRYSTFVEACDTFSSLESHFQQLRSIIISVNSLTSELNHICNPLPLDPEHRNLVSIVSLNKREYSMELYPEILTNIIEELDVAIAERDFIAAKKLLEEADREIKEKKSEKISPWEADLDERREVIVNLLEKQLQDPTGCQGTQNQYNQLVLFKSIAGNVHTLNYMLNLHSNQLKQTLQNLIKPHRSGGSDADGLEYTGSLCQYVFHVISLAIEDYNLVFNHSDNSLYAFVTIWAEAEVENCAELIKNNVFAALTGPSALSAAVQATCIAFVYAMALESLHQLSLIRILRKCLWPGIEGVLEKHFMSASENIKESVQCEMPMFLSASSSSSSTSTNIQTVSFDTCKIFLDKIEAILSILLPISHPLLKQPLSQGIILLLESFFSTVSTEFKEIIMEGDSMIGDDMVVRLMEIISNFVAGLLKAVEKISEDTGQVISMKTCRKLVDELASDLGLQQDID